MKDLKEPAHSKHGSDAGLNHGLGKLLSWDYVVLDVMSRSYRMIAACEPNIVRVRIEN
jgi:hypothetical protein